MTEDQKLFTSTLKNIEIKDQKESGNDCRTQDFSFITELLHPSAGTFLTDQPRSLPHCLNTP